MREGTIMITSSVPRDVVVIYNHALELSNRGDYDSALGEYRRAINAYPDFVAAYNDIGEITPDRRSRKLSRPIWKR